jgi:GNAT superfamily N-acetyltransferase
VEPVSFRLRVGVPGDGVAVAAVFGAARAEMRYLPRLHTAEEDVAFFSEHVLPTSMVTVAEGGEGGPDGELIGFAAIADDWLRHLYVAPAWQGRGIGRALLARAMADHRAMEAGLSLWVFAENRRARALYGRVGFVEVEWTDGSRNEEGVPDVRMRWAGGL